MDDDLFHFPVQENVIPSNGHIFTAWDFFSIFHLILWQLFLYYHGPAGSIMDELDLYEFEYFWEKRWVSERWLFFMNECREFFCSRILVGKSRPSWKKVRIILNLDKNVESWQESCLEKKNENQEFRYIISLLNCAIV